MRINYPDMKGIAPIAPSLPDIPETKSYMSGPAIMVGTIGHDSIKILDALRHDPGRRMIVAEDGPNKTILRYSIDKIMIEDDNHLITGLSREIELIMNSMKETNETYTKDFVSGKQKEYWLKDRMNRPNKNYNTTRNKIK